MLVTGGYSNEIGLFIILFYRIAFSYGCFVVWQILKHWHRKFYCVNNFYMKIKKVVKFGANADERESILPKCWDTENSNVDNNVKNR